MVLQNLDSSVGKDGKFFYKKIFDFSELVGKWNGLAYTDQNYCGVLHMLIGPV